MLLLLVTAQAVSLFTREWIEMHGCRPCIGVPGVSLFTREWIEIFVSQLDAQKKKSPSLRGSGLKFYRLFCVHPATTVSLFTREWIEIFFYILLFLSASVSLFTREWIEMRIALMLALVSASPSLRGSGLK